MVMIPDFVDELAEKLAEARRALVLRLFHPRSPRPSDFVILLGIRERQRWERHEDYSIRREFEGSRVVFVNEESCVQVAFDQSIFSK